MAIPPPREAAPPIPTRLFTWPPVQEQAPNMLALPLSGANSEWFPSSELGERVSMYYGQAQNSKINRLGQVEFQMLPRSLHEHAIAAIAQHNLDQLNHIIRAHELQLTDTDTWDKKTLLMHAIIWAKIWKSDAIVRYLLDIGAEVNEPAFTSLMQAAAIGDCQMVKLLLSRGANPCAASASRQLTPLFLAAAWNRDAECRALKTSLMARSTQRGVRIVQFSFDEQPSVRDSAAPNIMDRVANIELLLQNGADPTTAIAILAKNVSIDRFDNKNVDPYNESHKTCASTVFAALDVNLESMKEVINTSRAQGGALAAFASPEAAIAMRNMCVYAMALKTIEMTAKVHVSAILRLRGQPLPIELHEHFVPMADGWDGFIALPPEEEQTYLQEMAYKNIQRATVTSGYQVTEGSTWLAKAAAAGHPPLHLMDQLSEDEQRTVGYVPGSGKFPYPSKAALEALQSELGVLPPPRPPCCIS